MTTDDRSMNVDYRGLIVMLLVLVLGVGVFIAVQLSRSDPASEPNTSFVFVPEPPVAPAAEGPAEPAEAPINDAPETETVTVTAAPEFGSCDAYFLPGLAEIREEQGLCN